MNCTQAKEAMAALVVDGDAELRQHLSSCVSCRREAQEIERTLRALGPLGGATPSADDLFVASVRRGYDEARSRRGRGGFRLAAATVGLAAAAVLLALFGPRPILGGGAPPAHLERADESDFADEDPCELIGDLDNNELLQVQAQYKKGA